MAKKLTDEQMEQDGAIEAGGDDVIDLNNYEDVTVPVPRGWYFASVTKATVARSKAGHPKINVRWKIESGDHEGRTIFQDLSFAPDAIKWTKVHLVRFGIPGDAKLALSAIAHEFEGASRYLLIDIEQPTDPQYEPQNRVRKMTSDRPAEFVDAGDVFA